MSHVCRVSFNAARMARAATWIGPILLFGLMAVLASRYAQFPGDVAASPRVQSIHAPWLEAMWDVPEVLASTNGWTICAASLLGVLLATRQWWDTLLVAVVPVGAALNRLTKQVVDRPRPSPMLVTVRERVTDPSFPSGHTTTAVLLFGLCCYLAGRHLEPRWLRVAVQTICIAAIIGTGVARMYDGVHWFSDIYGSLILGGLILRGTLHLHRYVSPAERHSSQAGRHHRPPVR